MSRVCGDSFGECCFPPSAASQTATIAKIILVFLAFITALTSISTYLQYGMMPGHYTIAGAGGLLLGAALIHIVQMVKGCYVRHNTIHTLGEDPSRAYGSRVHKEEPIENSLEHALLKMPDEIKAYFTIEEISSFPTIDDVKLKQYSLGTGYYDKSMLKLVPKFEELGAWCLKGQDSSCRWMFIIKVLATTEDRSGEALIIIHQRYTNSNSNWTISAFGELSSSRIAASQDPFHLIALLLKGEVFRTTDESEQNPVSFSIPK